jgi:hypothetical protein
MKERLPKILEPYLGPYQVCFCDSYSGEPISWGYPVLKRLGPDLWEQAQQHGTMKCDHGLDGKWYLIARVLTLSEARKQYGDVTHLEIGPRGGFRSVTFGKTKFCAKELDPRRENQSSVI